MILLNVETDDYGVLESRPCGCRMGDLGLTTHVTQVRSFRKLTGEGMTLVGNDMIRILEEVLPTRFGGSPLDYQLAEVENEVGPTLRGNVGAEYAVAWRQNRTAVNRVVGNALAGEKSST